jgi:hypothetical protein
MPPPSIPYSNIEEAIIIFFDSHQVGHQACSDLLKARNFHRTLNSVRWKLGDLKKSKDLYDQGRWRPEVLNRSERLDAYSKEQAKLELGEEEIEIIRKVRKPVNVLHIY